MVGEGCADSGATGLEREGNVAGTSNPAQRATGVGKVGQFGSSLGSRHNRVAGREGLYSTKGKSPFWSGVRRGAAASTWPLEGSSVSPEEGPGASCRVLAPPRLALLS